MICTYLKALAFTVIALAFLPFTAAGAQTSVTPAEARTIAKEAHIYGFPLVDGYRIIHTFSVNNASPAFKAPFNQVKNETKVRTPKDRTVQTPNSDTLFSTVVLDLRTEPFVLTVPPIEKERYFSVMLTNLYTFNFDYVGSRTTGNGGGDFLIAGPGWKGETPKGVTKVIRSETELMLAALRTQIISAGDFENTKKVQAGYKVQPLSAFLGQPAPKPAPAIGFVKPLTPAEQRKSLEFFNILNFILQFCPTHPSEKELMARFKKIGVGAGLSFDGGKLSPELRQSIEQGMADAWQEFTELKKKRVDTGEVSSGDLFGTREHLKNNYLYRMAGAVLGIYGNSRDEALYVSYALDSSGEELDAEKNRYTLRYAPGQLPPANAFWSVTMYSLPEQLLIDNRLNRYLINSPMLPNLKRDADGGLTLYIQHESPGKEKESNWLPAPNGPFMAVNRIYWPKPEALDGTWKRPPMQRGQ